MTKFRILSGLPTYGPLPKQFSATGQGTHREGFVIEFLPKSTRKWVGNFQPGLSNLYTVIDHPNSQDLIVISGGQAYVISPKQEKLKTTFGGGIEFCEYSKEIQCFIFGNGLWFEIVHKNGEPWKTKRISWDGMQNIQIKGTELSGEAYDPMTDQWYSFEVDLVHGLHKGGSYQI
jgi:hypothetical protein